MAATLTTDDAIYWFRRDRKGVVSRRGVYTDPGTAAYWAGKRGGYLKTQADDLAADELVLVEESEASYVAFVAEQLLAAE